MHQSAGTFALDCAMKERSLLMAFRSIGSSSRIPSSHSFSPIASNATISLLVFSSMLVVYALALLILLSTATLVLYHHGLQIANCSHLYIALVSMYPRTLGSRSSSQSNTFVET